MAPSSVAPCAVGAPLLLLLCFAWLLTETSAFNVLPRSAIIISSPTPDNDYFGYTVQLTSDDSKPLILVGAPKAQESNSKYNKSGTMYNCNVFLSSNNGSCVQEKIKIDEALLISDVGKSSFSGSFRGSSIDVRENGGGNVVCAPKTTSTKLSAGETRLYMNGVCSWNYKKNSSLIRPYAIESFQAKETEDESNAFMAYAESGFSVHIVQDDYVDGNVKIVIGAPGYWRWSGHVVVYDMTDTRKGYIEEKSLVDQTILFPTSSPDKYSYLGYSVSSGNFGLSEDTQYVAGAPRADNLLGKVFIFVVSNEKHIIMKELRGSTIGGYFGASLCVVDLNKDGIDDLLVGAPLYSSDIGDIGAVYMYVSENKDQFMVKDKEPFLKGSKIFGGRYGTSIAAIGDVNNDGYPDVAIGAPYEDNGAIYIYHGSKIKPYLTLSQHIKASYFTPTIKGFGFSLSRGMDIDKNSYDDFAVGSYLSSNVVVLRSSPVIHIQSKIENAEDTIDPTMQEYNTSICHRFDDNYTLEEVEISVSAKIDPLQPRASLKNGSTSIIYKIKLKRGIEICQELPLTLQNNSKQSTHQPLKIFLTHKILTLQNKGNKFCEICPVLDPRSTNVTLHIPYKNSCEGTVCNIDISVKGHFISVESPFIVGKSKHIKMEFEVENKMEPSDETNVTISFPSYMPLNYQNSSCGNVEPLTPEVITLLCSIANPLTNDSEPFVVTLWFDASNIPWNVQKISIEIRALGLGEEMNKADNILLLEIPLERRANISIEGISVPDQVPYSSKVNENDIIFQDKSFQHNYWITNSGPTPIDVMTLQFFVPYGTNFIESNEDLFVHNITSYPEYVHCSSMNLEASLRNELISKFNLTKNTPEKSLNIECASQDTKCHFINCGVNQLFHRGDDITVTFHFTGRFGDLGHLIKDGNLLFQTYGLLESDHIQSISAVHKYTHVTQTNFLGQLPADTVEVWVIIVAIFSGLILLTVVVFLLWKCGFFKRNKVPGSVSGDENKGEETPLRDSEK